MVKTEAERKRIIFDVYSKTSKFIRKEILNNMTEIEYESNPEFYQTLELNAVILLSANILSFAFHNSTETPKCIMRAFFEGIHHALINMFDHDIEQFKNL